MTTGYKLEFEGFLNHNPFVIVNRPLHMGHNIYIQKLSEEPLEGKVKSRVKIEDNVGEGIHIHWTNIRFNLSIEDFKIISEELEKSVERLEKWE